jgi:hypothetical protein
MKTPDYSTYIVFADGVVVFPRNCSSLSRINPSSWNIVNSKYEVFIYCVDGKTVTKKVWIKSNLSCDEET